ncbi:MAG: ASCH domain-containing protein [Bryobacteraceae bacterium]
MQFTKKLREGVRRGYITTTVRIWQSPRVKVGGRYRMEEGEVVIEAIEQISLADITQELALESGFAGRADLLEVARHGSGSNVYLIRFRYEAARL